MTRTPLALTLVVLSLAACATPAPAHAAGHWKWPVRGDVITTYRNGSDPYAGGQHRGVDIAAPVGRGVSAPAGGRVTFAGTAGSSGLTVSIRTTDGRWDTSYLHLSSLSVSEGDRLEAGQRLGAVGTTGRRSSPRSHLHFGVREAGSRHAYHDPMDFLAPPGAPTDAKPGPAAAPLPLPLKAGPGSAPVPAADRGRSPAGARGRAPARVPAGAPGLAPAPAHARAGSAVSKALEPAALGPAPASSRGQASSPAVGAGAERAPAGSPVSAPHLASAGTLRIPHSGGGFDLGWVLACLGLAGAAALTLGRSPAVTKTPSLRVFRSWRITSRLRSTT